MNSLKLLSRSILCFFAVTISAAPQNPTYELSELLSNPNSFGEGTLLYSDQVDTENIVLGGETGIYGVGLALKSEWIPSSYKKSLDNKMVIQVFLGTQKEKLENKIPLFGFANFIAPQFPKETTAFTFQTPLEQGSAESPAAILSFSSPKTLITQNEQEQLQSTFFGKAGGVTLTPVGKREELQLKIPGNKISLKKQNMKFDFLATLNTPFSGLEKKLTGSVVFPIYSAQGKQAEAWFEKVGKGLTVTPPLKPQPEAPQRKITTLPPKKPKKLAPQSETDSEE